MQFCIIATGPSLSTEDVEHVRKAREKGLCKVIAVSNAGLDHAPWADYLVSADSKWWAAYPEALNHSGEKYSRLGFNGMNKYCPKVFNGCNSGLMAMEIAFYIHKATSILLLGFDLQGSHYFGPHTRANLNNTKEQRFKVHLSQFESWGGCQVYNCNPNSRLKKFPFKPLRDLLIL